MAKTRVALGALALALAWAPPAHAQASCSLVLYGTWRLRFAAGVIQHDATLTMNGCAGEMRVAFYNDDTRRREEITQRMSLSQGAQGIRISGFYPVYSGTGTRHPSYMADKLLYSVDPQGRATFRNCDEGGNCSPVEIISETRAVRIVLQNDCSERIYVALLFRAPEGRWMRRGWWVVGPWTSRETDAATTSTYVYFYADGEQGTVWHGTNQVGSLSRQVVTASFDREDSAVLYGAGLKTVSFIRQTVNLTYATHTLRFTCP